MKRKIAILGAGVCGLATAYFLQKRFGSSVDITIFEAKERVGGWLQSSTHHGAIFECGPRSLRHTTPELEALIEELDLGKELIFTSNNAKKRYLVQDGSLEPFPYSLRSLFFSKLGRQLLFTCLREPFSSRAAVEDESVASFFCRRIGKKATDTFISALCAGIYAACPEELSMRACFPTFWEWEQQYGSLVKAMLQRKKRPMSRSFSFRQGIEMLPKRLAERLECTCLLNQEVHKVQEDQNGVVVTADSKLSFEHLFVTIAPSQFGAMFSSLEWINISSTSVVTVSLAFKQALDIPQGFGFLCPRNEDPILLGMLFDSCLFPEQNGPFGTRLSLMMGGTRAPDMCTFSDSVLLAYAKEYMHKYLKSTLSFDHHIITRAPSAIARYAIGHHRIVEALANQKGQITLLGSGLHGVSVGDTVTSAYRAAENF